MSFKKTQDNSMEHSDEDAEGEEVPEGGWGYVVCIGYAILMLVITGPMSSFGLIYHDFFEEIGMGTSGITFLSGFYNIAVSLSGFITSNSLKYFTLRQVGIVGALLYIAGSIIAIFVNSVGGLVAAISLLQGTGFGILLPVSLTSFNSYFSRKRAALMSSSCVLIGLGSLCYPMSVKWLMETYGFRGTLVVLSGINFNLIPVIILFRSSESKNIQTNESKYHIVAKNMSEKNDALYFSDEKDVKLAVEPFILRSDKLKTLSLSYSTLPRFKDDSFNRQLRRLSNLEVEQTRSFSRASSLASVGNWTSNVIATETIQTSRGKWSGLRDFLDVSLLKDPIYLNICIGTSTAIFADLTFFSLEPIFLLDYGFNNNEVALCITATCIMDLLSRIIFAVVTFYVHVKSRNVFFVGVICTFIFQIVFMEFIDFYSILIVSGCLGFFRNWIHVFLPLVFAEYCSQEKFSAAYGLSMISTGLISVVLGMVVGATRDYTGSYYIAIHCISACLFIIIVCWAAEIIYNMYQKTFIDCKDNKPVL